MFVNAVQSTLLGRAAQAIAIRNETCILKSISEESWNRANNIPVLYTRHHIVILGSRGGKCGTCQNENALAREPTVFSPWSRFAALMGS